MIQNLKKAGMMFLPREIFGDKIMILLVAALTFLLPVGFRRILDHAGAPAHEWSAVFISFTDFLLLALAGWAILGRHLARVIQPMSREVAMLFFFLAGVGFSVAWHGFDPLSVFRFTKLILFVMFAFFVAEAFRSGKGNLILKLFVISALLQSALAVGQFLIQDDFGLQRLGESPLDPAAAGVARIVVGDITIMRAYGTFPHPNVLAAYLVGALFAVLALSRAPAIDLKGKGRLDVPPASKGLVGWSSLRAFLFNKRQISNVWWLIAVLPLMFALLITFSRAALAALVVGLIATAILEILRFKKLNILSRGSAEPIPRQLPKNTLIAFFFAVFVGLIVFGAVLAPFWQPRAIPRPEEGAVVERVFYADAAIRMIRENPVFGVGWGRFSDQLPEYVEPKPVAVPSVSFPLWLLQPVHNIYLLVGAEAGIAAMILFLVFAGILVWHSARFRDASLIPIIGGFIAILAAGFLDHFPFTIQQGALLFWFFAGILMAGEKYEA
jgi:O-antigen ligase